MSLDKAINLEKILETDKKEIKGFREKKSLSKKDTFELLNLLRNVTSTAQDAIKEYFLLNKEEKVEEIREGTIDTFKFLGEFLKGPALVESMLTQTEFERRIDNFKRIYTIKKSYPDLSASVSETEGG